MRIFLTALALGFGMIVLAFVLDVFVSLEMYDGILWPGYVVAGWLDGFGVIEVFDSSGNLAIEGIATALLLNFAFWSTIAFFALRTFGRHRARRAT